MTIEEIRAAYDKAQSQEATLYVGTKWDIGPWIVTKVGPKTISLYHSRGTHFGCRRPSRRVKAEDIRSPRII